MPDAAQAFSLTVDEGPVFTASTPLLTGTAGDLYTYTFAASGTPAPAYSLGGGAPSWLTIDPSTGAVSGTVPPGTTSFGFTVTATNAVGHTTVGPFTAQVSPAAEAVSLRYRGSLEYDNSGAVTSGSLRTITSAGGAVRSVSGSITVSGLRGGSATVTVDIFRVFGAYLGDIALLDPSVGFRALTAVLTRHLATGPAGTVSGKAMGFYRGHPYHLRFTV